MGEGPTDTGSTSSDVGSSVSGDVNVSSVNIIGGISNVSIVLLVIVLILIIMQHHRNNKHSGGKKGGSSTASIYELQRGDVSGGDNSDNTKNASDVLADMSSSITDVRGANGVQHSNDGARNNLHKTNKQNCIRSHARGNVVNSYDRDVMREAGMYGETVLSQVRDQAEVRGTKCHHPRANNTVKCVRELVDEGCPKLSPEEQLAEDRHLLTDYILPVDRPC